MMYTTKARAQNCFEEIHGKARALTSHTQPEYTQYRIFYCTLNFTQTDTLSLTLDALLRNTYGFAHHHQQHTRGCCCLCVTMKSQVAVVLCALAALSYL